MSRFAAVALHFVFHGGRPFPTFPTSSILPLEDGDAAET